MKNNRRNVVLAVLAVLALVTGLGSLLGIEPLDLGTSDSSEARQPAVRKASGRLDQLVGRFVDQFDDDSYREPSTRRAARLAQTYEAVRAGQLKRAATIARPLGYLVVRYLDRATGRRLVLLIERRIPRRGWGLYVHSPSARSKLVVEISHPVSDINTEQVGVELLRRTDASDLLIAGSRRDAAPDDSSDVAHNPRSAFEGVHRTVLEPGATIVQPHGFDSGRRDEQYGEIIVSSGGAPTDIARSLTGNLTAAGFRTCLYKEGRCEALGGTKNVQGQSARAAGVEFIHLELGLRLRVGRALRTRVISAVVQSL